LSKRDLRLLTACRDNRHVKEPKMPIRPSSVHVALVTLALAAPPVLAGECVPVGQLGANITKAIESKFQGAEVLSAERETENGKTKHEVKIRHEGATWEVEVADNGQITEMEREDDED
jgi:hypothetical protein